MRKTSVLTLVFVLATLLFSAQAVQAGQTSPGLERQMASMTGSDEITVLVVLRDQADIKTLNDNLRLTRAPMDVRHRAVIGELKDVALRSQGPILAEMADLKAADTIIGFKSYWLINAITVTTTVDGARQLALRDDVEVVEANMVIEMIEPANFDPEKQALGGDKLSIGITPGLLAINARRVWDELGIDGTGALVGNMDTGVDSSHPALSDRWRGNFAPASECWFDAIGYGDLVPTDHHYHGTHVMGTICGLAPNDTIGVAPGALWIANNTIDQGASPDFDSDVLNGLQWFSDPDGNPETLEDVPDVVQHSWGVNENFTGYFDCDSRWWDAIDNCEAAGVVNTWSAGNEGPGSESLRSPADRADSPYNCFSVGSTITSPPYTISSFSSRGPTGCSGTLWPIKPEVSAPGSNIYSAEPGGGYQYLSGTSMAGPHVAGVVALMRAANPDVDVDTIKQILMDTATDLGTVGEDNTYGHGLINAYDAVLAVLDGYGWIEGTVSDRNTGLPIPNAVVNVIGDPRATVTSADGSFSLALPAGGWDLEYSAFGYLTGSQLMDVVADMTVDGSYSMTPAPSAIVSGTVRDFTFALVEGATITVLNTPIEPVLSQADGTYEIAVPDGATYDIRARKDGLGGDTHTIEVAGPITQDFVLPELNSEDFESGDFQIWPWEMSGSGPWTIDSANPYEGVYAAKSGTIGDMQSSTMEMTLTLVEPGEVTFWYSVSSEATYDFLRFYIDNAEMDSWSGSVGWTQATYPISNGTHTFKWSYTKDQSVSNGSDAGWVDLIDFPAVGAPTYPAIGVSPSSMAATILPDNQTEQTLTLDNTGEGVLVYTLSVQETAAAFQKTTVREPFSPEEQWNRRDLKLAKGEKDPRVGQSPLMGAGGPDEFGYRWTDSDEPGGPIYQWVEINSVGTPLAMSDDTYSTGHAIGFPFTFYGVEHTTVNISTNGFLSFTSPSSAYYSNTGIPDSSNPNDMVCGLWDDLNASDGGTIYKYEDTANNRFIVEWDGVPHYSSGGSDPETMQIILNLDGSIYIQYKNTSNVTGCTVGIENMDGTDGLETVYNAAYLHNDLAIRYSDSALIPWLSLSPVSGIIESMNSGSIAVTYDATGMDIGTYGAIIRVGSNDPDIPIVDVPVTLTVDDITPVFDIPLAFRFDGAAPNPFNPMTTLHFSLPKAGYAELKLFDVQGRLVRTLLDGQLPAGPGQARWDGRDQGGRRVASGTYYARLMAAGQSSVKPLVLVK